ncbi:PilN domain-containing protein [Enterobacter sp. CC120223-11]|uniref:PilN domain-containing protein n=1 Tax=Enterobacter sp. CC120223-11 TaxID=1378073 RepID=UPI001596BD39|nr:PilN domain-containing protein [Enterobacter sp. CC120223-11]
MGRPINLLDWRERRRRECLRFWGLLFAGAWLIALALMAALRAEASSSLRGQNLRQENDRAVHQALVQREQPLRAEQQRRMRRLASEQKREATRRWQSMLLALSEQIPQQAWLKTLQWQGEALSFSGLANRFTALAQLATAVSQLEGVRAAESGPVRRDREGRWQFSYELLMEANNGSLR